VQKVSIFLVFLAGAVGCGGTSAPSPPPAEESDGGFAEAPDAAMPEGRDAESAPDRTPSNDLTALEVTLAGATRLRPTETATAIAMGLLKNGDRVDLSRAATWHTSSATTVEVLAGGRVVARGDGRAEIWASRGDIESNRLAIDVGEPMLPNEGELRGVWVTRWTYSNAADIQRIVDDVAGANMNAIFMQVRGTADAYYASTLEPWAQRLSGTLGTDPGWDPLGEMITRAHARGIQVHAWLNTFPAWTGLTPPSESAIRHPLLAHPEWLCADEGGTPMGPRAMDYQFFSPGNPAVREHITSVALEIATRYAVDGIHFDYVRYPGSVYCHDEVSTAEYTSAEAASPGLSYADFQRDRITMMLREVRRRLAEARPQTVITVANWGIYRNLWSWSSVSRGYDDYYQDAHRWAREGIVDALCPMTYWRITDPKGERTDWATLIEDHIAAATAGGRYAYTAIHGEHDGDELLRQVALARASGARGIMFFELGYLRTNGHLARLRAGPFASPAQAPRYPWRP
jgi:uncharacterized lipoprotein YddW (UPF0748 family)